MHREIREHRNTCIEKSRTSRRADVQDSSSAALVEVSDRLTQSPHSARQVQMEGFVSELTFIGMNLNAFFSYVSELSTCTHMHQPKYGQNEVTVFLDDD